MNLEEAKAWLRGERSLHNQIVECFQSEDRVLAIAQADAHMVMQAYYIVKAHQEGLVEQKESQ